MKYFIKRKSHLDTFAFHFITFLSLLIISCTAPKNIETRSNTPVGQSNFIFYGEVVKENASNLNITVSANTAIVQVLEVVDGVFPFTDMKGKEVTVILATSQSARVGEKRVYYTTGWHYGKTLGVKEVEVEYSKEMSADIREKVRLERIKIHDDSISSELRKASLVIHGIVTKISEVEEKRRNMESEHDPDYRMANIEIKQVIKGRLSSKGVPVYFSNSNDVMWYHAPKLTVGQEAIFLLQKNQAPKSFPISGYTILDNRDVQAVSMLPKLLQILK